MNWLIDVENWDDMEVRDAIMDEHGLDGDPIYGTNDDGELVRIDVSKNEIVIETLQENGWVRKDVYYYGEDWMEQIYLGKWDGTGMPW